MKHVRESELIEMAADRLSEESVGRIRAHLEACADCRELLDEYRAIYRTLGNWDVDESRDLWSQIAERLDQPEPRVLRSPWLSAARLTRVAAAVLVGVGLGYAAGRLWLSEPTVPVASGNDVDAVLALYTLENPSPAGLTVTVNELAEPDEAEGAS
jgi:anti-sigma factor RsiW